MLKLFILSFVVSLVTGHFILRWHHLWARYTGDVGTRGSHKVHHVTVSRIGGVSIVVGWVVGLVAAIYQVNQPAQTVLLWIVCLAPVFLVGLAEDLVKCVPPMVRLLFSFVTAGLAYFLLGAGVVRVDVFGIDALLAFPLISFAFTVIAIAGVAHAVNVIDGLNGLASSVCLMALIAMGYVAFNVDDPELLLMCGIGAGALLGLHVWNYPSGRVFCGDGGAYFLGGYIAILATLLVSRHPQVSAWFALLLVLYPVWETLFSAYRRRVWGGRPASTPDQLHLHTLIYRRMIRTIRNGGNGGWVARRNSDASAALMALAVANALPAVLWWNNTVYLFIAGTLFLLVYLGLYWRVVRFGARSKKAALSNRRTPPATGVPIGTTTRSGLRER